MTIKPSLLFIGSSLLFCLAQSSVAQITGPIDSRFNSIRQNTVSNIETFGDTLWAGPKFSFNVGGSANWSFPAKADSVVNGRLSNFSFALSQDSIVSGLGFFSDLAGQSVSTGGGIYFSDDGGTSWRWEPQPLDQQGNLVRVTPSGDSLRGWTTLPYGGREIPALAITVPQQSVPFSTDFSGDRVFIAGWASGLRRSLDFGRTWQRVLLPPFEQAELRPQSIFEFFFQPVPPAQNDTENPNTSESWTNFLAFSVFIDNQNRLWTGTSGGVNISEDALTADVSQISWRHKIAGGRPNQMLGNWVVEIDQNPKDGRIWLTNWVGTNSSGQEQFGVVSTGDSGLTFDRFLQGERIFDFAFSASGRVYAAGENGLFYSDNNGQTWVFIRQIQSPNTFIKPSASYQSVAITRSERLWVATTDGIAFSDDNAQTWSVVRVNLPLGGGNQFDETAKKVDTYAYPNPFSPRQHGIARIRFDVNQASLAEINLYDFGMNHVRKLDIVNRLETGSYEAVWDGTDGQGRVVANGVIFYVVKVNGNEHKGKIIIID